MLEARNVNVHYGDTWAVQDVSFDLLEGQWMMLAGPNGAGKSTLIRAIAQTVPWEGSLRLDGENLREMKSMKRARLIGVLAQHNRAQYGYTVEEIVRLGRYAYRQGFLKGGGEDTEQAVEEALRLTGMLDMREKSILNLSGGELQRAFLAQVFAQNPSLLILDEPANHLDLKYQQHVFRLISQWLTRPHRCVISVVHDLSLAARYGSHALLMHEGRVLAGGTIREVFEQKTLEKAFGMDVYAWMQELMQPWQNSVQESDA